MNLPEKILIVENEAQPRISLRACLGELGFMVVEATHGERALEQCLSERPDLVLLDINLPDMSGFEVCRRLQALPELREIPVIVISRLNRNRDRLKAFAAGAVDFLNKPFQFSEVEARVRTHLKLRRQQRQLTDSQACLQEALTEAQQANHLLLEVNERLRRSEELKSHFIANMRNEINDPLGAILGLAAQICDLRIHYEQRRELASLLHWEVSRLDFKLRNIFCAAELEAGEATPSFTKVDIMSVLRNAAEAFADEAQKKPVSLVVEVAEDCSPFLSDADKIRIILANLLANAIEFTPAGGRIVLRARRQNGILSLEVEDEGIGLSEADLSAIFERFRQLDSGHARAHHGQGLGLAVVKALVELLDGQILVESEPGHGTKFTCRLPQVPLTRDPDSSSFDGNLFIFDEPTEL